MPFKKIPHPEMVSKMSAVAQVYTPQLHARLISLFPTSEDFAALAGRYQSTFSGSLAGNDDQTKACEETREEVNTDLAVLDGLAKALALKDPTVPEILGLGQVTGRQPSATILLTSPEKFKVVFAPNGDLIASMAMISGAKVYQVWCCDNDPSSDANGKLVAASGSCKGISIGQLNRIKPNWLRARAISGRKTGPWSNIVMLPAL